MIGTIRRHQQWLWLVIIAGTILSFVYAFSPASRNQFLSDGMGSYNFGSINGEPITREQMRNAEMEARILLRRNTGKWPDASEEKELLTYARQELVMTAALDEYHINPTQDAAARFIKQFLGVNPDNPVPPEKILEALTQLAREGGVSLEDFDRFARHQVGQQYLIALVGMSGKLVTPQEMEVFYRRENEPIETELVSFPASNYYSMTTPTEKDIDDFYTRREADYRLPDRIQVNYVEFPASNYLAKAMKDLGTNLSDHIDQEYLQATPAAFKDEDGKQLSAEAAKAKIKKGILQYATITEARKDANAFLNDLSEGHDEQHPYAVGDLFKLAQAKHLTVKTTEPFDQKNLPKELAVPPASLRVLFSLREDDPDDKDRSMLYDSSPLLGENSVYVVGLQKRIPSRVQTLDEVHAQVIKDFRRYKSLSLAKEAGDRFQSSLEAGLNQGKTFDTMCAAQFVHPKKLTPFSLTATSIPDLPDKAQFEQIQEIAGRMHTGQHTPFIPTEEGGFILYVKGRLPADDATVKKNLPMYMVRMRQELQIAAFQYWFSKQYSQHFVAPQGEVPASGG